MQGWEAGIDRKLVARLARSLVQPGVIGMALVRRILAGVAALTERLPLLARFGRYRELVATTRIVHAQWTRSAPGEVATTPPVACPIVHAVPSRTVERSSTSVVTREPPATAILEGVSHARPSRSTSMSPAIAAAQVGPVILAQGPRPAARVGEVGAARESQPTAPQSSHDLVRIAGPTVRRSRVGAPLPARPQTAARVEAHGPPPAALLVAPAARTTATSRDGDPGRSIDPPVGELGARAAVASPALRVRPRAAAAVRPARIADATAPANLPVVAVKRAAPPVPAIRPIVAPFAGPGTSPAGRHRVPSVSAHSGDGDPARARELPLAHPLPLAHSPPAAPAAIAALPAASVPGSIDAPRSITQAAVPSATPPQKIDLHRLAEQVQHILVRQAAHTRARQGLPR